MCTIITCVRNFKHIQQDRLITLSLSRLNNGQRKFSSSQVLMDWISDTTIVYNNKLN